MTRNVPCTTLNAYLEGVPRHVTFAKMDVEGAEVRVLRGAEKSISARRIGAWLFEVNQKCLRDAGASAAELFDIFRSGGYEVNVIRSDDRLAGVPPIADLPTSVNCV